eukprot:225495_1
MLSRQSKNGKLNSLDAPGKIGEKCITSRYAFGEKEGRKIARTQSCIEIGFIQNINCNGDFACQGAKITLISPSEHFHLDCNDTAQVFDLDPPDKCDKNYIWNGDEKYPSNVFSCGRHIEFMVDEDPIFPQGFHENLKLQ